MLSLIHLYSSQLTNIWSPWRIGCRCIFSGANNARSFSADEPPAILRWKHPALQYWISPVFRWRSRVKRIRIFTEHRLLGFWRKFVFLPTRIWQVQCGWNNSRKCKMEFCRIWKILKKWIRKSNCWNNQVRAKLLMIIIIFYRKRCSFIFFTLGGISAYHDIFDWSETLPMNEH